ncbi:OLC1v1027736C1 [Oldenlandia corymbosa var. corymbosa]|uniref:OLC1v1027736C1 n=1 Tax=Oldenlandia corymbosa var. corymbosa TaxID=529605 RepID=A0AAV1CCV5_OLDCO|nr:OLC1v1027736C1 [Oldenlandia corymbosa var. corymbosa]
MGDSSASYIHMVQHLIEKCLIFNMSKEECMDALSKHANIKPVITSTVWNELEKENKDFFEAYAKSQRDEDRMSEAETSALIQKMVSDHDDHEERPKDPPLPEDEQRKSP